MSYEAIFIDWDGTLSNSRFWQGWRDDPRHGEKYEAVQESLFMSEAGKQVMKSWMLGQKGYENVIGHVSSTTSLSYGELEKELRRSAQNMEFIDVDVLKTIQHLRDIGSHVVIATDNMDTFEKWTVPALGLQFEFDEILSSSSLHALKSWMYGSEKSMFFDKYMIENNIEPCRTVLIDDSNDTRVVEGAGIAFRHVTAKKPLSFHLDTLVSTTEID